VGKTHSLRTKQEIVMAESTALCNQHHGTNSFNFLHNIPSVVGVLLSPVCRFPKRELYSVLSILLQNSIPPGTSLSIESEGYLQITGVAVSGENFQVEKKKGLLEIGSFCRLQLKGTVGPSL